MVALQLFFLSFLTNDVNIMTCWRIGKCSGTALKYSPMMMLANGMAIVTPRHTVHPTTIYKPLINCMNTSLSHYITFAFTNIHCMSVINLCCFNVFYFLIIVVTFQLIHIKTKIINIRKIAFVCIMEDVQQWKPGVEDTNKPVADPENFQSGLYSFRSNCIQSKGGEDSKSILLNQTGDTTPITTPRSLTAN